MDPQSCKHSDNPTGRLPSRYGRAAGPDHLEPREDVAREEIEPKAAPFTPVHTIKLPVAPPSALDRAAETILAATRPLIMIGAEGSRPRLVNALSSFVQRTRLPFFNTQMGKGAVTGGSNLDMGTAALSERDYVHRAIDQTDLIISIGHDTMEKPPFIMGESGPGVMHIGFTSASVEQVIFSHAEVVGDIGASLTLLIDRPEGKVAPKPEFLSLRQEILARINDTITRSRGF